MQAREGGSVATSRALEGLPAKFVAAMRCRTAGWLLDI